MKLHWLLKTKVNQEFLMLESLKESEKNLAQRFNLIGSFQDICNTFYRFNCTQSGGLIIISPNVKYEN